MPKQVRFIESDLVNFTSHRQQSIKFGDVTKLSGRNGQGKTSIGTAPVWVLWGTDIFGSKFNPAPVNYNFDRVFASLLLSVDGVPHKFAREIDGGTNRFYINDVPVKAKEYEAAVAGLFDKDEFLSLYNPSYFFGLHWTKQREQILKYVTAPAKSEVLKHLPDLQADRLGDLTKKHSLDDLVKIHGGTGGQKSKLEKQHIAAHSRTKTLQEQLDRLPIVNTDIEAVKVKEAELREKINAADKVVVDTDKTNAAYTTLQARINSLQEQISASAKRWPELRDEPIEDTCRTCKQALQDEAVKAVTDDKERRKTSFQDNHKTLVSNRKDAEAELAALEWVDVSEQRQKVRELEDQLDNILETIRTHTERDRLAGEVEKAKTDEVATLASLKESIFILDAIKAYRAKEAELQAEKVQSLFTTLSIRLFKYVKSSDDYEPDFSIQMDGKDYVVLSAGEKIAAGLELTEVLFKQSELIVPCFIDGIESYTGPVAVYDQLITGRAVPGQELKIETEGEA
ncbi:AAA family ATPase [Paenibacillus contaminans]|uniref:ATPase n=1 Tax=Paenibacillus contaminans TaxID=450362 RepID=A0A329MHK9_9BACL|nr:ATP-binding protein [Paenibacillus contaminans]RAV18856.1 ATPase [Paenibacillus contaminans]